MALPLLKKHWDSLGNVIKSTYANKLDLGYSSSNNRIAITLKSYDGTSLDADLINLPKATYFPKDGFLLAKEDKIKINAIASDIASAISTHDGSQTSHLYIRTLINNLQKEVDRINAKGRSWGEVDKTFSELWAMAEPTRLLLPFYHFWLLVVIHLVMHLVYIHNNNGISSCSLPLFNALFQ